VNILKAKLITSKGEISVDLFDELTPKTVDNFRELASSGFYTRLVFHRIVKNFVIQTGDPNTKNGLGSRANWGMGGSKKTIPLEIVESLRNSTSTLGMARSSDPNSASSQFYINLSDNSFLDGKYTVFGKVSSGMDVVNMIADVQTDRGDAPIDPSSATLESVSIG
jgi:peptidyl-prolyl cis-trans isomerase B (cyclophilin B)